VGFVTAASSASPKPGAITKLNAAAKRIALKFICTATRFDILLITHSLWKDNPTARLTSNCRYNSKMSAHRQITLEHKRQQRCLHT
jgi:hypothetical protein